MPVRDFFPYKTRPDSILLNVDANESALPVDATGNLPAVDVASPRLIEIRADAAVPLDLLDETLPAQERAVAPTELRLVIASRDSRQRFSVPMPGEGFHAAEVRLPLDQWRGDLEIRACLVRTSGAVHPEPGFASEKGALLAWSRTHYLSAGGAGDHVNGSLVVEWREFSRGPEWLSRQADSLFALDTVREPPVLLLNTELHDAAIALSSTAASGGVAAARDAAFSLIAHQVWTSLLAAILLELTETIRDRDSDSSVLLELRPWQRAILRDWAQEIYPSLEPDEASTRLLDRARSPGFGRDVLLGRIPEAIQRRFSTAARFQDLFRQAALS